MFRIKYSLARIASLSIHFGIRCITLIAAILVLSGSISFGQETAKEEKDTRPVRSMFESAWLIDNQSAIVPIKGTLEFDINHRFGVLSNGYDDVWGIFAPSNIRLGLTYSMFNNTSLGFGFTKNLSWDFNLKYALIQQTRSGNIPLSITYFGNAVVDTRSEEKGAFRKGGDRWSYFHQLILARKISSGFSLQIAPSYSHFNAVQADQGDNGEIISKMKNDHIALALGARIKIGGSSSLILGYDLPLTDHPQISPESNLSLGVEFVTSSHAFQVFIGNYYNILPQLNNALNRNDFWDGDILLGFNMTRLWNF